MELIQETRSTASLDTRSVSSGNHFQGYSNSKDNVKVVIRVRPLNEREKNNGGHKKCVTIENESTIHIESKPDFKSFNFDFVGDENIEQEIIFSSIAKPIADCCLEGYNGTIFAYGQTGAGKTFTIQGPSIMVNGEEQIYSTKPDNKPAGEFDKRGIMQRSFEYIFESIERQRQKVESQEGSQFDFLVRCSYLEIYNEQIMDLLEPTSINLHIREDIKKGVYVEGLQEEVVSSAKDMMEIIHLGAKNRHVGSTSMNKESSRSHSVLTTIIETKQMKHGGVWHIKTSRFHIIDLAGSERSKYTNAVGDRLKEAGMINKSLSALGNVINSLVDISEGKSRHVHYRDSKLTFLLRDSLGGNSKTVIIANISPSSLCYGETLSTLKFAQRAKLIRNKAVINEDSSGTIQLLKAEIIRLQKELAENEKMYQQIDSNPNGYQCSTCKGLIGNEIPEEEDELLINNISVCEDLDSSTLLNTTETVQMNEVIKQKLKNQKDDLGKMRKRIVHLEGLLTANLDTMASQQKYYDNEILKLQQQNKKLQQAVESYEKQSARDKMIIKFREERIAKLEASAPITKDDQAKLINDLRKEIQTWKEQFEHNAQAAKLFAEKSELSKQLEQLKAEHKQSPDSLSAQMRQMTELNESLNQYLKLFCEESKKEVENELSKVKLDYAEKIEQLNETINELKLKDSNRKDKYKKKQQDLHELLANYKTQIEHLTQEHIKERLEIERQNHEQIENIKNEISKISENKSEQEKELQLFKIQVMEKEQQISRERESKQEIERQQILKQQEFSSVITELEGKLNELKETNLKLELKIKHNLEAHELLIETERKNQAQIMKEREQEWQDTIQELENKIMEESGEKQAIQEQSESLADKIRNLEQENETLQQSMMFKDEQIEEIKSEIREKDRQMQIIQAQQSQQISTSIEQTTQFQYQLNTLQQEKETLQKQLDSALSDKNDLKDTLDEIKQEIGQLILQREELLSQIAQQSDSFQNTTDEVNRLQSEQGSLQKQILSLEEELAKTQNEKQKLNEDLLDKNRVIQTLNESKIVLQTEVENLRNDLNELTESRNNEIIQLQQQSETQKTSLQVMMESKIKDLLEQEQQKQNQIEQLNLEVQQKDQIIEQIQIQKTIVEQEQQERQQKIVLLEQETQMIQQAFIAKEIDIKQLQEQNQRELQKYQEQQQYLESQAIQQNQEIARLQELHVQAIESQNEQLNLRESIIKRLECQIQELKNQHQDEIASLQENLYYEKEQIQTQLMEQISEIKEEKEVMRQQMVQAIENQQKEFLESQVEVKEAFLKQIEELNSQKQEEIQKVQQDLLHIQEQKLIESVNKERESLTLQIQELESQINDRNQQILDVQAMVKQLEQEIFYHKEANLELKNLLEQKQAEYNSKLAQLEQNIQEGKLEAQNLNEKVEQLQKQKELELELISQNLVDQSTLQQQELQQKILSLEEQNQQLNLQQSQSSKNLEILQTQLQEIEKILQNKDAIIENQETQIDDVKIQISQIQRQYESVQDEKQNMQIQNTQLNEALGQQVSQIKLLNEEICVLNDKLSRQVQDSQNLKDENSSHQEDISNLQQEIIDKDTTICELNSQLQEAQDAIQTIENELRDEISLLRNEVNSLELERTELSNQLTHRETLNTERDDANRSLREQIMLLQNQVSQVNEQLTQKDEIIVKAQEIVQEKEEEIQILQQDLKRQGLLLDDTIDSLNADHVKKLQDQEQHYTQQIAQLKSDSDKFKQVAKELNSQTQKLRHDNEEQNSMLKQCRDTIAKMASKEGELIKNMEQSINQFAEKHNRQKQRLEEAKEQLKATKIDFEKARMESDNLKELIKLKDKQIEDQHECDEKDKQALEQISKENKDLRNQLTKREFELRDLVKRIKFYSEEKSRLEVELDKAHRENDELIGHKNPSQKIQHHVRIKEENNKLREENVKLQEELRKKMDLISKYQRSQGQEVSQSIVNSHNQQELEIKMNVIREENIRFKKENQTYQETINRLVDHFLSQPGLLKAVGLTQEDYDKLMQQSGPVKVKKTMEITSIISNLISQKEREVRDLEREVKQYECKVNIIEKEKIMYKQQLEIGLQPNMANPALLNPHHTGVQYKRSPSNGQGVPNHHLYQIPTNNISITSQINQGHQQKPSRLFVEGFQENSMVSNGFDKYQPQNYTDYQSQMDSSAMISQQPQLGKQSPSPIYNIRQQKEKENIQTKKELFSQQQRSGSARRTTYLQGHAPQQQNSLHK